MSANQTTLSIDKETKAMAEKRAKEDHLPLSTIVKILLGDYAMGILDIGSRTVERDEDGFTPEKSRELLETIEKAERDEDLSPTFNNSQEAIAGLNSQGKDKSE